MYRNFPEILRIGAMPVYVEFHDELADGDRWGDFDCVKYRIRLDTTVPSSAKAIEVVIHEILHGIYRFADIKNGDDEERLVTTFSTWLAMVLVDNPRLVKWLVNAMKS
jgi:hypothetical protein